MSNKDYNAWVQTAYQQYGENRCEYHNWDHVLRLRHAYEQLTGKNVVNGTAIDLAIIWHDVVYDFGPQKEFHSAWKMLDTYPSYVDLDEGDKTLEQAFTMIMSTTNHSYADWPEYCRTIIRCDLYDLTQSDKTILNFGNIMRESMRIYNIDERTFAENNIAFMTGLIDTCKSNIAILEAETVGWYEEIQYWYDVIDGCERTVRMSREILS